MARQSSPWARKGRGWYAWHEGRQHKLAGPGATKSEAWAALRRLQSESGTPAPPAPADATVGAVVAGYLDELTARARAGDLERSSPADAARRLSRFAEAFGARPVGGLQPAEVLAWATAQRWAPRKGHTAATTARPWSPGYRREVLAAARTAARWAVERRLVSEAPPLAGLRLPRAARTPRPALSPADYETAMAAVLSPRFRDLCAFIHATGCRPGEARRLEARHVDWTAGVALMRGKTTRATGRSIQIVLPTAALARLRELAREWPEGPVFRNEDGAPWTKDAVNCQIRRVRARAGLDGRLHAHALRKLFATDRLVRGASVADVAALLNHGDARMLMEHYSQLTARVEHLRRVAE